MAFYVGQKVVCVEDDPHHRYATGLYRNVVGDLDGLTAGRIYTVRACGIWIPSGPVQLWLKEIIRKSDTEASERFGEPGFAAVRFRPVVERKTDISALTALLDTNRVPEVV